MTWRKKKESEKEREILWSEIKYDLHEYTKMVRRRERRRKGEREGEREKGEVSRRKNSW